MSQDFFRSILPSFLSIEGCPGEPMENLTADRGAAGNKDTPITVTRRTVPDTHRPPGNLRMAFADSKVRYSTFGEILPDGIPIAFKKEKES